MIIKQLEHARLIREFKPGCITRLKAEMHIDGVWIESEVFRDNVEQAIAYTSRLDRNVAEYEQIRNKKC